MKLFKLLFELIKTNILFGIHKLKTRSYLIAYSIFLKNYSTQIILSYPMNVTGKITWKIIEDLQKKFSEMYPDYQCCSILGITKIKKIK